VRAAALRLRREMRAPLADAARAAALAGRWRRAATLAMSGASARVDGLAQSLAHLSPRHVLERGYAIVARKDNGDIVQDARTLARGDALEITLSRGRAAADVTGIDQG
jgi:exodeoxyribonuclease VII large subunit